MSASHTWSIDTFSERTHGCRKSIHVFTPFNCNILQQSWHYISSTPMACITLQWINFLLKITLYFRFATNVSMLLKWTWHSRERLLWSPLLTATYTHKWVQNSLAQLTLQGNVTGRMPIKNTKRSGYQLRSLCSKLV